MALFSRLLALQGRGHREEDFFTELVAHILNQHEDLALRWLKNMGVPVSGDFGLPSVSTQVSYAALADHASGTRPDLLVEFSTHRRKMLVFIESKIGSSEGPDQLRTYANVLASRPADHRVLIYVTRRYDPKDADAITEECPDLVFVQSRWHEFYRLLGTTATDPLIKEVRHFMEATGMSRRGTYGPSDLLALQKLPDALSIVEESLSGEIAAEFERVLGSSRGAGPNLTQLRKYNRYILLCWMDARWWCGLGFFFGGEEEYPQVGLVLEVSPVSSSRDEILSQMRKIEDRAGWTGHALGEDRAWSRVAKQRGLQEFLGGESHLEALQQYFRQLLDELEEIRNESGHLPWTPLPEAEKEA